MYHSFSFAGSILRIVTLTGQRWQLYYPLTPTEVFDYIQKVARLPVPIMVNLFCGGNHVCRMHEKCASLKTQLYYLLPRC